MKHKISPAFAAFRREAPDHAAAWMEMAGKLGEASALDEKTAALVYLGMLAVLGLEGGIPFHAAQAREAGAGKEEAVHAVLLGLPAAGSRVTQALPALLSAFEE